MVEPDVHVPPPVPVTIENVPGPAVLVIVGAPKSLNASVPLFVRVIVPVFGLVFAVVVVSAGVGPAKLSDAAVVGV